VGPDLTQESDFVERLSPLAAVAMRWLPRPSLDAMVTAALVLVVALGSAGAAASWCWRSFRRIGRVMALSFS
jgi:hypothetical protein